MTRTALGVLALVLLLYVAAALGAHTLLNTRAVRLRVARAVETASGHATNLADGAGLFVSGMWRFQPAIEARDVKVLNPPGFSRPAFATVARASAAVSLWPLLFRRVEVSDVRLDGVDVLAERDAAGHGNWERPPPPPSAAPAAAPAQRAPWAVQVGALDIRDVAVSLKDGPSILASRLHAASDGTVSGTAVLNGVPFAVSGTADWAGPSELDLAGAGMQAHVSGRLGATVAVRGRIADLSAFALLVGRALPALRDVAFDGEAGPGGAVAFHATAGASDLGSGLRLAHAQLSAPALDKPVRLTADGTAGALPVSVTATLPRVPVGGTDPVPFEAQVLADGGTVSLAGTVPRAGGIPDMTATARIPDLRHAGTLAGVALPALTTLAIDTRIAPAPNGPGLLVRGLRATAAQGDIGGDLLVRWAPRPLLRGSLVSQRLDLDAILAPSPPAAVASPPSAAPAAVAPPSRPVPFAALRAADADLRLSAGSIAYHGGEYRALQARLLLQDGRLRLDPAQVQTPGGTVDGRLAADATATPPTLAVTLLASGLDAAPLATAFGKPGAATGTVDLDLDLRAAGADWRVMAPTLDGHAGVAMVNGDVENQILLALFGPALKAANLPADAIGRSKVRCFALRFDAAAGRLDVKTLALDASRARLDGEGTLNLVDSTLDFHLRPTLRIGGTAVAVPVHLAGPLHAPVPTLERGAISPGRIGLSILGGGAAAQPDICGPALAAARGNRPGAAPQ